ncbi:MAG TPA: hypothetical protein VGB55_15115, partial [Tepidisphaeraceae bacterium]
MMRFCTILIFFFGLIAVTRADTVSLIDGRTLEGKISFEKDALTLQKSGGASDKVNPLDVLSLDIADRKIKPETRNVTLINGTVLAAAQVLQMDERETSVKRADSSIIRVNTALVSAVTYAAADAAPTVGPEFVGVAFIKGDLAEGEILSADGRVVRTSSVLFGLQEFELAKIRAVYLRPVGFSAAMYVVRTIDGSIYQADALRSDRGKCLLSTDLLGVVELNADHIVSITLGAGAVSLAQLAGESELVLTPGQSRAIELGGQYRAAVLTFGVPPQFLPTRTVRFVIEVAGKEIARVEGLTSLTPPRSIAVPLEGAASLMIRVDATGPAGLGTAGAVRDGR